MIESVLDRVDDLRHRHGSHADRRPEHDVHRQRRLARLRDVRHGEGRRDPDERDAHRGGRRGGERDGNEGPRPQLEEEKLDGEEHRRDRAAEGGGHSRGGAGSQQRLPLDGGGVQELPEQGAESAAGGDDGTFGTERPAGADGDGRGDGLEHRNPGGDTALVEQNLLHRFGNAVAADGGRPVARHQPDDDRAGDRHQDHEGAQPVGGGRNEDARDPSIEGEVRDEADQARQRLGDHPRGGGDDDRERADEDDPRVDQGTLRRDSRFQQGRPQRRRDRESFCRLSTGDLARHWPGLVGLLRAGGKIAVSAR